MIRILWILFWIYLPTLGFAKERELTGLLIIPGGERKSSIQFYTEQMKSKNKRYLVLKNAFNQTCKFEIRDITAPVQSMGIDGKISVYPSDCEFKDGKDKIKFKMIALAYHFLKISNQKELAKMAGDFTIPEIVQKHPLTNISLK